MNNPYAEQIAADQAIWLDKIMKRLLPKLIYERGQHTSYEQFVSKWLAKHAVTFAQEGEKLAVLREGKVYASWEPGQ